jgi:hypothetical protein
MASYAAVCCSSVTCVSRCPDFLAASFRGWQCHHGTPAQPVVFSGGPVGLADCAAPGTALALAGAGHCHVTERWEGGVGLRQGLALGLASNPFILGHLAGGTEGAARRSAGVAAA